MTDQENEFIPPKDRVPREPKEYPYVYAGEKMLAIRVSDPEDQFELRSIPDFDDEAFLTVDQFTEAYLLDEEGSRYWVRRNKREGSVEIVAARVGGKGSSTTSIDPEVAEQMVAKVGYELPYGDDSTGQLKEIVAVNRKPDPSIILPDKGSIERTDVVDAFVLALGSSTPGSQG